MRYVANGGKETNGNRGEKKGEILAEAEGGNGARNRVLRQTVDTIMYGVIIPDPKYVKSCS